MKWVSKGNKKKYSIKRFFKSFTYAFMGIIEALRTEQNLLFDFIYSFSIYSLPSGWHLPPLGGIRGGPVLSFRMVSSPLWGDKREVTS